MSHAVADLLHSFFGVEDALDQAEYLLTISDPDDVREWVVDALGLDETNLDENLINDFLTKLLLIREGDKPKNSTASHLTKQKIVNRPPRPVQERLIPVVPEDIPTPEPAPIPRKPVPASRRAVREKCSCLAKTELSGHPLIGNCVSCGRIVCGAEDYGDCLTCGASKETIHWIDLGSFASVEAASAVEHKDRLVQYDREGTRRTQIYDDSTDWFAEGSDIWKGKADREEALRKAREFEEQKNKARLGMQVEIDFATGQIVVKDKAETMQAVEQEREKQLATYIEESGKVFSAPQPVTGNVLNKDSEELLNIIRAKLGKGRVDQFAQPISIMSVLDDL